MKAFRPASHLTTTEHSCCHHVAGLKSILTDREHELLLAKGPCSSAQCRLHHAHSGPCAENGDTDE